MIPTMVRSLGYSLLPAASRAAELPTQITQSPGTQPTASTATCWVFPSFTTSRCLCSNPGMRLVETSGFSTLQIFIANAPLWTRRPASMPLFPRRRRFDCRAPPSGHAACPPHTARRNGIAGRRQHEGISPRPGRGRRGPCRRSRTAPLSAPACPGDPSVFVVARHFRLLETTADVEALKDLDVHVEIVLAFLVRLEVVEGS